MKTIFILCLCLGFSGACTSKRENIALKAKVDSLTIENEKISKGQIQMAATVSNYEEVLEDIDKNLESIDEATALVRTLTPESEEKDESTIDNIKGHIANISVLLENSRLKIITLDKNLNTLRKESGNKSDELLALDEKIKTLTNRLLKTEMEMYDLEEELRAQISNLQIILDEQLARSAELEAIVNRVYYIKGTGKALKELGIIKKEGGFIGLGQVKVLNATASPALFEQIRKDQISSIDLSCRKAKLITTHPAESYSFLGEDIIEKLRIEDNESFWRNSNYLVIEVDKEEPQPRL